jgi:hypothetical protein
MLKSKFLFFDQFFYYFYVISKSSQSEEKFFRYQNELKNLNKIIANLGSFYNEVLKIFDFIEDFEIF